MLKYDPCNYTFSSGKHVCLVFRTGSYGKLIDPAGDISCMIWFCQIDRVQVQVVKDLVNAF